MAIKSFSLTEEEAYIIEKEAKQQGISQSELIRKLLSNTESSYQKKKAEQIETLFLKIGCVLLQRERLLL